jgi:hypothetical protein
LSVSGGQAGCCWALGSAKPCDLTIGAEISRRQRVSEEQSHARSPHQQQQDHTHKPQRFALHSHTPFSSPRPLPLSLCVHSRYPTPSLSPTPSRTASRRTASTPLRPTPISAASGSIATVKQHGLSVCVSASLRQSLNARLPSPLSASLLFRRCLSVCLPACSLARSCAADCSSSLSLSVVDVHHHCRPQ